MLIGELEPRVLAGKLRRDGIGLDLGAARVRIRSDLSDLAEALRTVYAAFPLEPNDGFFDVTVSMIRPRGIRRYVRAQVDFFVDGVLPFEPFPADTHLPLLEWGINSCFAQRANQHLLLHAAVVEKRGRAVILPALPGTGKSTLTAALACRGYRLLSDEFAVVRLRDRMIVPMLKPPALKNESIGVIRRLAPEAVIGPRFAKTRKGTVAHLAPDAASVAARHVPARAALVVFPKYKADAHTELVPVAQGVAFSRLAVNSFNYELLGPEAFDAAGDLIEACDCYAMRYSRLEEAIETMDELIELVCEDSSAELGEQILAM